MPCVFKHIYSISCITIFLAKKFGKTYGVIHVEDSHKISVWCLFVYNTFINSKVIQCGMTATVNAGEGCSENN